MLNCKYCNKELQYLAGLRSHERNCSLNPSKTQKIQTVKKSSFNTPVECYCSFCNKLCTSKNSLINHERLCKLNPKAQVPNQLGKKRGAPWNKGLTAEVDERVARQREATIAGQKRYAELHPEATTTGGCCKDLESEIRRRKQISESMKKNPNAGGYRLGSGRGKKGWYKGFFCDSTYELVYIIYNLDHNISFKRSDKVYIYEYNGELHKYHPDFELSDGSLVEVKGYHTEVVDIKATSVVDRSIKVLYEPDLQYAFDWVKQNYQYAQLSDLYE